MMLTLSDHRDSVRVTRWHRWPWPGTDTSMISINYVQVYCHGDDDKQTKTSQPQRTQTHHNDQTIHNQRRPLHRHASPPTTRAMTTITAQTSVRPIFATTRMEE
eukprot:3071100-Rhodomonas_salina.1